MHTDRYRQIIERDKDFFPFNRNRFVLIDFRFTDMAVQSHPTSEQVDVCPLQQNAQNRRHRRQHSRYEHRERQQPRPVVAQARRPRRARGFRRPGNAATGRPSLRHRARNDYRRPAFAHLQRARHAALDHHQRAPLVRHRDARPVGCQVPALHDHGGSVGVDEGDCSSPGTPAAAAPTARRVAGGDDGGALSVCCRVKIPAATGDNDGVAVGVGRGHSVTTPTSTSTSSCRASTTPTTPTSTSSSPASCPSCVRIVRPRLHRSAGLDRARAGGAALAHRHECRCQLRGDGSTTVVCQHPLIADSADRLAVGCTATGYAIREICDGSFGNGHNAKAKSVGVIEASSHTWRRGRCAGLRRRGGVCTLDLAGAAVGLGVFPDQPVVDQEVCWERSVGRRRSARVFMSKGG